MMIVYHGSPHKFDAFDASKIGTGEGAQAYGHGMYFAESPDVARQYQETLSKQVSYGGRRVSETHPSDSSLETARHAVAARVANGEDAATAARAEAASWREQANFYRRHAKEVPEAAAEAESFESVARSIESLDPSAFFKNPGALYKVDLPDEAIARMLDWDKPLSQQPEVVKEFVARNLRENMKTAQATAKKIGMDFDVRSITGKDIYLWLTGAMRESQVGATRLRNSGIPGIRYLDQGSRATGGTSNFVVFPGEEQHLQILCKF